MNEDKQTETKVEAPAPTPIVITHVIAVSQKRGYLVGVREKDGAQILDYKDTPTSKLVRSIALDGKTTFRPVGETAAKVTL